MPSVSPATSKRLASQRTESKYTITAIKNELRVINPYSFVTLVETLADPESDEEKRLNDTFDGPSRTSRSFIVVEANIMVYIVYNSNLYSKTRNHYYLWRVCQTQMCTHSVAIDGLFHRMCRQIG
jgi:hypothetical protein